MLKENASGLGTDGPGAAEQQPQQGCDVGDGAHGAARAAAQPSLVDGDDGGQVVDGVHGGAGQRGQEAADEGGQGLVELAAGLHRDGVEDEGGLAGAGHAGDGGQEAFGDGRVDGLQVVFSGSTDLDPFRHIWHD
ncbi:hypothetical protein ACFQ9X_15130 [Catenulispora yoronensis]